MVGSLPEAPSVRLLKHIIRCYLRLSDNARAREALRQCLPSLLVDPTFTSCLKDDVQTRGYAAHVTVNPAPYQLSCLIPSLNICDIHTFSQTVSLQVFSAMHRGEHGGEANQKPYYCICLPARASGIELMHSSIQQFFQWS